VRVPERVPAVVGENWIPMVHVLPAATLATHVLVAMAKSPLEEILEKLSVTF
jgi:hypothetical protein